MSQPDFQPTLVGPRITIRPSPRVDWPELFAAGSDPKIWEVHPVPDRYTEAEFRKFFDGAVKSKMGFVFVDRATGRLIGSSRYYGYAPERGEIEIGWTFIAPAAIGAAPPTARASALFSTTPSPSSIPRSSWSARKNGARRARWKRSG